MMISPASIVELLGSLIVRIGALEKDHEALRDWVDRLSDMLHGIED